MPVLLSLAELNERFVYPSGFHPSSSCSDSPLRYMPSLIDQSPKSGDVSDARDDRESLLLDEIQLAMV